ncbi:MAG: universal stress protein [Caulobacterales bacterium]|nr:universal stress protein [Caulobacterales bacterium]
MHSPIRRIVVCLDGSPQGGRLGRQAAALARRLDARLIGLWGLPRPVPSAPETFARGSGAIHAVLERQALREHALLSAAREAFGALARLFGLQTEFRPVWDDNLEATALGAAGDLIVVGHPRLPGLPEGLTAERLLLACGRPVLIVPADWGGGPGGHVLIGWNGSRAARQAVDDALPLIPPDALATILVVDQAAPPPDTAELMEALHARGLGAAVRTAQSGEASVAETITKVADDLAAELVVLGGYSRSPTVERWFGGVTRSLLAAPPKPLLLSRVPAEMRPAATGDERRQVGAEGPPPASFR